MALCLINKVDILVRHDSKTSLILFANLNEFLGNSVEGLVTLEREGVANDSRAG